MHVIGQHRGQECVVRQNASKGCRIDCCKGRIGGGKHRERTCSAQVTFQACGEHSCFKRVVVRAVDDDVNDGVGLAPSGDHECHCSGNECKEMLHRMNRFGI